MVKGKIQIVANPREFAKIFKAYDIRGRYPAELNEEVVGRITKAYCAFLDPRSVVVGRDVRESGPPLVKEILKVFTENGVRVLDIGMVPVDVFYFAVAKEGTDGGLFVSASHNPREWNGVNLTRRGAEPISSLSGLGDIRRLAEEGVYPRPRGRGTVITKDVTDDYLEFVISLTRLPSIKVRPMKVVIDGNFGVSAKLFRRLVAKAGLPITLIGLNEEPDGTFPKGPPNPLLPENRKEICRLVLKERADFGIAWDADGDRCFFVDEKGNFIEGYFVTALLADTLLARNPGATVITDPRLLWATEEVGERRGGRVVVSRPGMTLIAERMKKEGAIFAGEMSSHFYFRETMNRDNGFLPALLILEMMTEERKKFSQLVSPFTEKYFISGEINFSVTDAAGIIHRVEEKYRDGTITRVDGLSVEYPLWRFNLRASHTEPLLRLNVEAKRKDVLEGELKKLKDFIERNQE